MWVIQIPRIVEPDLGFEPAVLGVELNAPKHVELAGLDLADGAEVSNANDPLSPRVIATLAEGFDTAPYLPVPSDSASALTLLLAREGSNDGTINSLRIFWTGGEPILWQAAR